jgi:hypothetical protein
MKISITPIAHFLPGLLIITATLAGCQAPPKDPPMRQAISPAAPTDVIPAIIDELNAIGFDVSQEGSTITATLSGVQADPFVACDKIWVTDVGDRKSRRRAEDARTETANYRISVNQGASGSVINIVPSNSGNYVNSFTNLPFDARCGSTGELERRLSATAHGA